MAKVFSATIKDSHSVALYDAQTGNYEGIIYITSGSIIGMPIITPKSLSVQFTENGFTYMAVYDLPSRNFNKKIPL